ncbi:MAG: hypothetical protein CW346_20500 [Bacillaceae bacterium]|nr:hypothetical protein [Bacillaceae bacterium]
MRIIPDLLPDDHPLTRLPMTPRYITVHDTANPARGANAEMHGRYLRSQEAIEENGTPVDVAVNHMGTGADTTYVRGRPGGRYYLEINAANIDWVVRVEELR